MRAGEHQTAIAAEFGVDRKTIRRRLDALAQAENERAQKRVRRQAEREQRKLLEREQERDRSLPLEPSRAGGRAARHRTLVPDSAHEWLEWRKNLSGRARAAASGLVRVRRPDGSLRRWVERDAVERARRKGYGRAMLAAVEELLARRGIDELRLNVSVANEPARHLYETAGYEQVGQEGRRCHLRKQIRGRPQRS